MRTSGVSPNEKGEGRIDRAVGEAIGQIRQDETWRSEPTGRTNQDAGQAETGEKGRREEKKRGRDAHRWSEKRTAEEMRGAEPSGHELCRVGGHEEKRKESKK
jgi:hypothetical protein